MVEKTIPLALLIAIVTACASTHPEANGKAVHVVECLEDEKYCLPQIKELCPNGYAILNTKSHLVAIWQGVDVVNRIRFKVTVECH